MTKKKDIPDLSSYVSTRVHNSVKPMSRTETEQMRRIIREQLGDCADNPVPKLSAMAV